MSSVQHYRYIDNAGVVVGYGTVNIDDELLMEYEIDNSPYRQFLVQPRSKHIPILKPSSANRLTVISRSALRQAIIIVHDSDFADSILATIPPNFDGVYVVKSLCADGSVPAVPGPVYNGVAVDEEVYFPIYKSDVMNFHFQMRLDINHDIRQQIQASWGLPNIRVSMKRVSKEVMNMMFHYIPDLKYYVDNKISE
jgi:hypothetical protein